MANQTPIPQKTVSADYTMTQDDQRIAVDSTNAVTVTLPDAAESYRLSRRFVLINANGGNVSWKGMIDTGTGNATMMTLNVPSFMFREAVPYRKADGSCYYTITPAVKDDTRGVVLVDKNSNRVANVRTINTPGATVNDDGNSTATLTIDAAPVQSVNTKTGAVVLGASDVGAAPTAHSHAIADVTGLQTALNGKQAAFTTISDAQHGQRAGGDLHALATQTANGFMSANDKKKLDAMTVTTTKSATVPIPAIALLSTTNVTVTWDTPFPSTVDPANIKLIGLTVLGTNVSNFSSIDEVVASRTRAVMVIKLTAAVAVSLGGKLLVTAQAEVPVS
jgi:hypothetical protein